MNTVRIDDQMGAMALVDALRAQQLRVEEHLDLPRRREAIALRIREYYAASGQPVDDAMIAAGVKAYFVDRLTWKPHGFTGGQAKAVRLYVQRDQWLPRVRRAATVVTVAAIGLGSVGGLYVGGSHWFSQQEAQRFARAMQERSAGIERERTQHEAEIAALRGQPVRYAKTMVDSVAGDVQAALAGVPPASRTQDMTLNAWEAQINAAAAAMGEVSARIRNGQQVVDADQRLVAAEDSAEFSQGKGNPKLVKADEAARNALRGPGSPERIEAAWRAVGVLEQAVQGSATDAAIRESIKALQASMTDMGMNAKDRAMVEDLMKQASDLSMADSVKATTTMKEPQRLVDFAGQHLELRVVNRSGVKSGVERTYKGSGGKAWYVIVEAVTPTGAVVPVRVTNGESGATEWTSRFGVRVSQDQYERVKRDKQADGIVDDALFATKARGRLDFDYTRAVMAGTITAW